MCYTLPNKLYTSKTIYIIHVNVLPVGGIRYDVCVLGKGVRIRLVCHDGIPVNLYGRGGGDREEGRRGGEEERKGGGEGGGGFYRAPLISL